MRFILVYLLACLTYSAIPTGDTFTNAIGMKFKRIPAGTFMMGFEGRRWDDDSHHYGLYNEYPRHSVTISNDFFMAVFETMQKEFDLFRKDHGKNIAWYKKGDSIPVHHIGWAEADSFCKWLTANDPDGYRYRLPTEAEWEYSCRAGTTTFFYSGDNITSLKANIIVGYPGTYELKPVGCYPANGWGLYDMHGNVWEWCQDWYGYYQPGAQTDPAGYDDGEMKVFRGRGSYQLAIRCAARPAAYVDEHLDEVSGFRVVISDAQLNFLPKRDTLAPLLKNVTAFTRPVPTTLVTGESYTNEEGMTFKRVRMGSSYYPVQLDTVVYVCSTPIVGDSGKTRRLAGLYARRLSEKYGVLYHLSNRYELLNAGIATGSGSFYLTILPDLKYPAWAHPDVSYYRFRQTMNVPIPPESLDIGPLWQANNHDAHIWECPNGDLAASWSSAETEGAYDLTMAGTRLRLGTDVWDSTCLIHDLPLSQTDWGGIIMVNKKGVAVSYSCKWWSGSLFTKLSYDGERSWTRPAISPGMVGYPARATNMYYRGGDSVVCASELDGKLGPNLAISVDGGVTWKNGAFTQAFNGSMGFHPSGAQLDNGDFIMFTRGRYVKNSDSIPTCFSAITSDVGASWKPAATPFTPPGLMQYNVATKLFSGRLLFAVFCNTSGKNGVALAESEDGGKTWFCRRKLGNQLGGNGDVLNGYMGMVQSRDGIIHLFGNSKGGSGKDCIVKSQASFSEQWLREGNCLDVADWGVPTSGMVAAHCPTDDDLLPFSADETPLSIKDADAPYYLSANPNPFNPSTTIRFNPLPGLTGTYSIFSIRGEWVRSFKLKSGAHSVDWDSKNAFGQTVPAGMYLGRLELQGQHRRAHKLLLLK